MQTLLIGCGNSLRGDDAAGLVVVERVEKSLTAESNKVVTVLQSQQLLPELAEPMSKADQVIIVDAAVGGNPGEVTSELLLFDQLGSPDFTHHVTPAVLLAYVWALYGRSPPTTILSITAKSFDLGVDLSSEVRCGIETAVALIQTFI